MRNISLRVSLIVFLAFAVLFLTPTDALAVVQTINGDNSSGQTISGSGNVSVTNSGSTHTIGLTGLLPIANGGTNASSFTNGSIFFFNGTSFAQDNSNFFWDNTNKRLGIGTSSPTSTLDVNGNLNVTGTVTTTNLVPYTGASSNLDLGDNRLFLGIGNGHGYIQGENALGGSNASGSVLSLFAGTGDNNSSGGYIEIRGGYGGSGSSGGSGGDLFLMGGDARGTNANGGNLEFRTGVKVGSGQSGAYRFLNPDQSLAGILDFSLLSSSNKTFTFPNASGTFGLLGNDQTWSGLNKFQSASNSTIYVGSSSLPGCIALGDTSGSGVTYITANAGVLTASSTKPSNCQ